ncbi:signal peptidase II [Patescibacteria group bacterium]|nr:signal peptidase II [Patescibacteria group bacterium]
MAAVGRSASKLVLSVLGILALIFLDQGIKFMLAKQGGFFIWPNFLDIGFYQNRGIAFGIPLPLYLIYPLIAASLILIVWRYGRQLRQGQSWIWLACWMVLMGAASNLFDRLYWGYVVDYIHFSFGSTFNVADMTIVAGVVILLWRELEKSKTLI